MNLFDQYNPNTDYDLASVADFKVIPDDLKIMYTVIESAKFAAIQTGASTEPLVDLEMLAARQGLQMQFAPGTTKKVSVIADLQLRSSAADRLCEAARNLLKLSKDRYGLRITNAAEGRVDMTLFDIQTGESLWLGTPVDAINTQLIHTWHCDLAQTERDLRVILYGAMVLAGFINFPLEWWHYSYGDMEWALHTDHKQTLYDSVETLR